MQYKWAILMGGVTISGGTNVIFELATRMHHHGVHVTFVTEKTVTASEIQWHTIKKYFNSDLIAWKTYDSLGDEYFDVAMATFWRTFYFLQYVKAKDYVYFVQSIESRFYPLKNLNLRRYVEDTYELGIGYITEAKWIKNYLNQLYGHESSYFHYGIDKQKFSIQGESIALRQENHLRVLVEGNLEAPFKNVPSTIKACIAGGADEIWLLTPTKIKSYKGVDRIFSQVPIDQVNKIYRSCDVIVKLSLVEGMFGPPLEMFHCGGTSIVYAITGHDEYIEHGVNSLVAPVSDESAVVSYLKDLKAHPELLAQLKQNAAKTADNWITWDDSTEKFVDGVLKAAQENEVNQEQLKLYSDQKTYQYEASEIKRLEKISSIIESREFLSYLRRRLAIRHNLQKISNNKYVRFIINSLNIKKLIRKILDNRFVRKLRIMLGIRTRLKNMICSIKHKLSKQSGDK